MMIEIIVATNRASLGRDARTFILYLLAAAVLHFPHYGSFIGDITRDFYLHYNWAKEFAENFALGNPYPRWMFHGRLGLGEPVFIFYAPLHYYAVALVSLLGLSAWAAMQVVAMISTTVFAWFVYKTCAYYAEARLSAMIGLVALASPFLVMLNYKFDGLAWATMGYASHGFLFWALFRPGASRNIINVWAAIAIGVAVGSHIISALVNLVCYSATALFPVAGSERLSIRLARSIISWVVTVALGLALSGIYLVPALAYLDVIRTAVWDPVTPFTAFAWPVVTQFIYEQRWFSFQWTIPLPALALVVVPFAYALVHKDAPVPLLKAISVGAFAVFFASELSFPIWALHTPLEKIQLPFRFISLAYTLGIVAAGLAIAHARPAGRKAWSLALWSILALSFLTGALSLVKASYLDGRKLPPQLANNQYTFLPFVQRLHDEGECAGGEAGGDTACLLSWGPSGSFRGTPEYRLKWAGPNYPKYAKGGFAAECVVKGVACGPQQRTATGLKWEVTSSAPQSLVLPLFHFPSWATEIDGKRVEHTIDPATGLITVEIPAGTYGIQTVWTLSSIERYGLYLSVAALLIVCAVPMLRRLPGKS
ncbi:MAG: hypothetical protein RKR03_18950 [Candidatus Competibacter sp.]|nr:hypothetical protein [Candidatus Competibacter sp.]